MYMGLRYIPLFLLCITAGAAAQTPFTFVENKGQWDAPFAYRTEIPGGAMFLEKKGITYHFADYSGVREAHIHPSVSMESPVIRGHVVKVGFAGANSNPEVEDHDAIPSYYNYYLGDDPSRWVSELHPVKKVTYRNVWNNIDVQYYAAGGRIKYDVIVNPGGDYRNIGFRYEGFDGLELAGGELKIKTSLGEITEQRPYVYQVVNGEKVEIPSSYELNGNEVRFVIRNSYDPRLPLIVDPVLVFASYTGSTADNFGMTATYDNGGHFFTGGTAFSIGYPTTAGAYQTTTTTNNQSGITDVVITKFSPDGSTLVYSTYIGGGTASTGAETVHSLIVNENDELFLFGVTSSNDFPTTTGAYDSTFAGGSPINFPQNGTNFNTGTDLYVSCFNSGGTALLGSTYIGGTANDGVNYNTSTTLYDSLQFNYGDQFRGEIMLDRSGNCYVASSTKSSDFPVVNGFQPAFGGAQDAVVFKFDPSLTNLMWSTYIGGSDKDAAYSVKIDTLYNVYVTGGTSSADFTTTPGTIFPAYQGGSTDAYICKISPNGTTLLHSTYIGTASYDQSYFLELDKDADVYIYGQTRSPGTFPVMNATHINPNSGQFITKMDSAFSGIIYSSLFGNGNGDINISPTAFLVDICENVYISGWGANILQVTPLTGMPVTPNALQPGAGDGFNFYISVFSTDFDSLVYATYFGGNISHEHVDGGTSRFDKEGKIYQSVCAGCGGNDDFPTTPGAWSNTNNSSNCNNGVFKLDIELPFTIAEFDIPEELCMNYAYQFTNQSNGADQFYWDFGDGDTSAQVNPLHIYDDAGTYTVMLVAIDTSFRTCIAYDTTYHNITIVDGAVNQTLPTIVICEGQSVQIGIPPEAGNTYLWNPDISLNSTTISNPLASPDTDTDYLLLVDDGVCVDTIRQTVEVDPDIPIPGFTMEGSATCSSVNVAITSTAINTTGITYVVNGDTLAPGDTIITTGFGQTITVTQIAVNGVCKSAVTNIFSAGSFEDYYDKLEMPNVFTPFGTFGENDYFCPVGFNGEYCFEMIIYNRWGRSVFESSADGPCWDGYVNNTTFQATDGVYFYVITWGGKEYSAFFHLISGVE